MRTKKYAALIMCLMIFVSSFMCLNSLAVSEGMTEYKIDDLALTISLPSSWKTYTPDMGTDDPIWEGDSTAYSEMLGTLASQGLSLASYAMDRNQHCISVRTYINNDDSEDYSQYMLWELAQIARVSCIANDYLSYEVVETEQTRFLVFEYTSADSSGNPFSGILYHTVVNKTIVEIDYNAFNELSEDCTELFNETINSIEFDIDEELLKSSNKKLKDIGTIAALVVLAIALVTVITIYIVQQVKKGKKMREAVVAADAVKSEHDSILGINNEQLQQDTPPPAPNAETNDATGVLDNTQSGFNSPSIQQSSNLNDGDTSLLFNSDEDNEVNESATENSTDEDDDEGTWQLPSFSSPDDNK